MLIAADDALKSAAEAGDNTSEEVDSKFREVIDLLSCFEKDFPSTDPVSDPNIQANIGGVTMEVNISNHSESPLMILSALKKNLHSKVKFPSVFFTS